jgi:anti-sigma factor RsiW
MVTPYVKGELSDKEMERFLKHIEQCSDCMDELDIYFTVYQAMDLLDTGENQEYDFKKRLWNSIRMSKRRLLLGRIERISRAALLFCSELCLAASVIVGIQAKLGRQDTSDVFRRVMLKFQHPVIARDEVDQLRLEQLSEQISEASSDSEKVTEQVDNQQESQK